jgi:hypothetical protein
VEFTQLIKIASHDMIVRVVNFQLLVFQLSDCLSTDLL